MNAYQITLSQRLIKMTTDQVQAILEALEKAKEDIIRTFDTAIEEIKNI